MTPIELKPGERIEDLGRGGYSIIQNPDYFCFGMDAVLLSSFAAAGPGEKVLDLGTGSGIIPILMHAKTGCRDFTGLEIHAESADMAARSVLLDDLQDDISIVTGDIKEAAAIFGAASFDVVTSNPPYIPAGRGLTNPDASRAAARHEILCSLEDVVGETAKLLKPGGRFYLVHRPGRLPEIMRLLCGYRIEPKRMRLVHPFSGREANLVLIEAVRGAKPQLRVERPLVIFEEPGVYTAEVKEIYGE